MRGIFPDLKGRLGYVNLNVESRKMFDAKVYREYNPLLDPSVCEKFVTDIHRREEMDFSYGGYLEDRSHLWRGHYQEKTGAFTHLGVDFNVPVNTAVSVPVPSEVVYTLKDGDEDGGWGGMVVLKTKVVGVHYLFAHLRRETLPSVGSVLPRGSMAGLVAGYPENGNWYPHLHMQVLSPKALAINGLDFRKIDGYAKWSPNLEELYPNPMSLAQ